VSAFFVPLDSPVGDTFCVELWFSVLTFSSFLPHEASVTITAKMIMNFNVFILFLSFPRMREFI
jgi:hypothetical protein